MPFEEQPHRIVVQTLSTDYTAEHDLENGWWVLIYSSGFRLNLSPETAANLFAFLQEELSKKGGTPHE